MVLAFDLFLHFFTTYLHFLLCEVEENSVAELNPFFLEPLYLTIPMIVDLLQLHIFAPKSLVPCLAVEGSILRAAKSCDCAILNSQQAGGLRYSRPWPHPLLRHLSVNTSPHSARNAKTNGPEFDVKLFLDSAGLGRKVAKFAKKRNCLRAR